MQDQGGTRRTALFCLRLYREDGVDIERVECAAERYLSLCISDHVMPALYFGTGRVDRVDPNLALVRPLDADFVAFE